MDRNFTKRLSAGLSLLLLGVAVSAQAAGQDAGSGPTEPYTVSCPSGVQKQVPIVQGPCSQAQKDFADTFGCNRVDNFYRSCRRFFGCLAENSSGRYAQAYRNKIGQCDQYR